MQKKLLLSLLAISASSCQSVTIQNTTECAVAGKLAAGMYCAETLTGKTSDLTLEQTIEFLEPKEAEGPTPARAGAVCRSMEDFLKQKNVLEQACRILGKQCTFEMQQVILTMNHILVQDSKAYEVTPLAE